ncbi:hypothetical protein ROHU_013378 [Labeo rohita]|uniref:Uncharacterized protein n=1 Tax=Labeo rohita TaxID=84645 RepID=A0A498L883_LABRO|nr:hypothetical protein ROHU_013378 [Labeo rohita]
MLTLWAFCGTEEKGGKRGGMAGIGACVVRGRLTLGTAPGAEEREGRRGGMAGIGACVVRGRLTLGTAPDAEEREGKRGGMGGTGACAISGGRLVLRAMGRGRGWENSGAKAASGIFPPVGAGSRHCGGLWRRRPALRRHERRAPARMI